MAIESEPQPQPQSQSASQPVAAPKSQSKSESQQPQQSRAGADRQPTHWYASTYDPIRIGSIDGTDTVPHDRALVRALHARFDPTLDPEIQGDPTTTLFVGRLAYETTEETLRAAFETHGAIRRLRLVRHVVTQESRGYAFIEFADDRGFRRAYHAMHRQVIDGRTILVDFERSRMMEGWKPRRLGGGLGGRKESGQLRFGGRDRPFKPPRPQSIR